VCGWSATGASAQATRDRGARFALWDTEPCGHVKQNRLDVAMCQCVGCDKTAEPECGDVQSVVALADRCLEKLSFFGGECRGGITAMWCSWLDWWSRILRGESLQ
jgi:hypothetical protein